MIQSLVVESTSSERLRSTLEALKRARMRATFFANPSDVLTDVSLWHQIAADGHEIGNAALAGVSLSGELLNWTVRMVEQDLHMTQTFLEDLFGDQAVPVFVFPGHSTHCADGDYREVVSSQFDLWLVPPGQDQALEVGSGGVAAKVDEAVWRISFLAKEESLPDVEAGQEVRPIFEAARRLRSEALLP